MLKQSVSYSVSPCLSVSLFSSAFETKIAVSHLPFFHSFLPSFSPLHRFMDSLSFKYQSCLHLSFSYSVTVSFLTIFFALQPVHIYLYTYRKKYKWTGYQIGRISGRRTFSSYALQDAGLKEIFEFEKQCNQLDKTYDVNII